MNIKVESRNKEVKDFIFSMASFYAKELNLEKSKFNLTIKPVAFMTKRQALKGAIYSLDDKELYMVIDYKLDFETLAETMAHEMIHAKQYARGQLKSRLMRNGNTEFKWLGKVYKTAYYDCPWEIDCFRKEKVLSSRLMKIFVDNK